jgi:hypothetical protein
VHHVHFGKFVFMKEKPLKALACFLVVLAVDQLAIPSFSLVAEEEPSSQHCQTHSTLANWPEARSRWKNSSSPCPLPRIFGSGCSLPSTQTQLVPRAFHESYLPLMQQYVHLTGIQRTGLCGSHLQF